MADWIFDGGEGIRPELGLEMFPTDWTVTEDLKPSEPTQKWTADFDPQNTRAEPLLPPVMPDDFTEDWPGEGPREVDSVRIGDVIVTRSRLITPNPSFSIFDSSIFSVQDGFGFRALEPDMAAKLSLWDAFELGALTPGEYPQVVVDVPPTSEHYDAALAAAILKMHYLKELDPIMDGLNSAQTYMISPTEGVTGAFLKQLWNGLSFRINLNNYPDGYGGENINGTVHMNWQTALGYANQGQAGVNFIALHEVMHNTPQGVQNHQGNYTLHLAHGGVSANYDETSQFFILQEQAANRWARDMAGLLFLDIPANPTHGYGGL